MVQGDAYSIDIEIKNGGQILTSEDVELVEIIIHDITKKFPGDVTFSDGKFHYPITQQETFNLPRTCHAQVRVKFPGGDVIGSVMQSIDVYRALSKAVL